MPCCRSTAISAMLVIILTHTIWLRINRDILSLLITQAAVAITIKTRIKQSYLQWNISVDNISIVDGKIFLRTLYCKIDIKTS